MPLRHTLTVKVRGYHCDFYGHVNNARYLEFLEEARWSFFEEMIDLASWQTAHNGFVVAGVDIRFKRPAPEGSVLEIISSIGGLGEKFGVIRQEVNDRATGKRVAEADVTFAVVDTRTGRAQSLTGEVREPFERASTDGDRR